MIKRPFRLYNVMFPLWMLLIFPIAWLVVLPVNFIIDTAVLLIALRVLHVEDKRGCYKKSVLWVWGFGFLSDIVGAALLFACVAFDASPSGSAFHMWWYENLTNAVPFDPFSNIFAFLFVLTAVLISGLCIYCLNLKISFRKLALDIAAKKKLALAMAVFTAPYLFFFPSRLLYGF